MMTAAAPIQPMGDVAVTRWREDATRDDNGSYIFLRDTRSGAVWSAGFQPTASRLTICRRFQRGSCRDRSTRRNFDDNARVLVSAEDDAEVRRVSISNAGGRARDIEITSYSELVWDHKAQTWPTRPLRAVCRTEYSRTRRNRRDPPKRTAFGTGALGGPSERRRRRSSPASRSSKPTGRASWAAGGRSHADRDHGRAAADQFGRGRARSDFRLAPTCSRGGRGDSSRRLLDHGGGTREALLDWWTNTGTRRHTNAQRPWPGLRRRFNSITSASIPASRTFSTPR